MIDSEIKRPTGKGVVVVTTHAETIAPHEEEIVWDKRVLEEQDSKTLLYGCVCKGVNAMDGCTLREIPNLSFPFAEHQL